MAAPRLRLSPRCPAGERPSPAGGRLHEWAWRSARDDGPSGLGERGPAVPSSSSSGPRRQAARGAGRIRRPLSPTLRGRAGASE
eukprot:scaffold3844_cov234-Prasinococcus_capsulatus_cf.AAC.1